ncbi:hypothetical protein F5Y13DRAFT_152433 [Hypoxylon sp. FL1857]|nr:hypothetical protein F5Y13DRAFT_152433 [Hypoxylon sp. FL1857]
MDPNPDDSDPPPASQASSHFPLLEPVSGATLYELESARREKLKRRGRLRTGCDEIDDRALLGGFERGEVVGVSAEEAEFGLLVGLQTVAHAVLYGIKSRAAIITTLPTTAILPTLRDVIRAQVQAKLGPAANYRQAEVHAEVRRCLEQISVSRVFDVEGLWEVLSELETPLSPPPPAVEPSEGLKKGDEIRTRNEKAAPEKPGTPGQPPERPTEEGNDTAAKNPVLPSLRAPPEIERTEVGDSEEDEDEELSLASSLSPPREQAMSPQPQPPQLPSSSPHALPPAAPPVPTASTPPTVSKSAREQDDSSHIPDLILITHFSSLLTNLFTRSADNKTSAHTTLQLLSSHLRYLARSSSGPLIMLLNTTTSTASSSSSTSSIATTTVNTGNINTTTTTTTTSATTSKPRPLEPTLRSIFNSAPPLVARGAGGSGEARRQNKPAFGATFAQFLDLHLLCTRVPRTRADAEALFGPTSAANDAVKYCWAVEVLLDELGVWEWDDEKQDNDDDAAVQGGVGSKGRGKDGNTLAQNRRWARKSREQRWGAVDVRGSVRLVDAFQGGAQDVRTKGPVRVAAGFGGPPARGL